ncbi:neuronal-specific septin-3 isoform X2 [Tamandua tetradactyla]|uniref:neuronal-specific septin-3 isoform X2 n=1 Tax=Tamandua tetradactyla TaxID=48850 RepID=UPI004053C876
MDHDFAPAPPEMQPHGAPGPRPFFSRSHLLGRSAHTSRLPGGMSPLIPVLRKTIHLDAFPQSHIPQASGRPGPGVRARSVGPQEIVFASGAATAPLPANGLAPRKLSSISLTLRQSSQARPLDPQPSHWEELPSLGREAAAHGEGRLLAPGSSSATLLPGGRARSQGPGSPGMAKPSRMPTAEKPMVSSHLALPFQSRSAQSPQGPTGPGPEGQGHSVPAHMPPRVSTGRGKMRPRSIPRPRLRLQKATAHMGPATAMDLATPGTRGPGTARHLATLATNRPSLAIKTAILDIGTEFPVLDTKSMDLAPRGPAQIGKAMNLATAGTTKPDMDVDLETPGPDKPGMVLATEGTAKPYTIIGDTAINLATPAKLGSAMDLAAAGTAKLNMDLVRTKTPKLGITMDSLTLDISSVIIPQPAIGEAPLRSAINLTPSDIATYPVMPSRGTALTLDHTMANATTDSATELATLDWVRETRGLPETRTDAAMSELVPEPRPKPAVPMKPVGINSNLLGYIGIDTIIEQMRKKTMKTGFDFNIMVVGQSGLGKSTLVNTLFKSQVSRKASSWNREEKIPKTVEIKAIGHVIEEGGVKMKLTVIDTPGFGDQINNENCWEPIEKYINEQYEKFLKEEVNIARKKRIPDTRVHCCLYFISPTGHSLRPLDLEFMKHLSKVVNVIPVIAKADTMTLEEKSEFKQRVRKELEVNGIEFYPQKEFDEDLEDKTENDKIRESMPFAVVGSDKEYQVNGKRVLGRKTPWGIIEVENLNHCEFALLRDFVIRTHLQDLKEVTHNIHYETYRAKRLNDNGGLPPGSVDTEDGHSSSP